MSNNRDDKFEGQDDSEYHFSDEEVSYEVESETPAAAPVSSSGEGRGFASRMTGSRRMLISFVVFLAIVFVVYKVVSPSSSTPSTDITAAPTVSAQTGTAPAATSPQVAAPAAPVVATTPPPAPAQPAVSVAPPAPALAQQPQQLAPATQNPPAVATLPAVIPVQSALPAGGQSPAAAMGAYIEDKSQSLTTASQQAMAQIQTQYTQQFNEFTTQNKSLQSQIQTLSTRVADMETQINQLVQVLTRRNHAAPPSSMNTPAPHVQPARSPEVKIAYNVQAIIPGRAWLKSENGETLTVAEGDVIRDVGRVTKIDPYDGVVEINTGTKAVSLSYGNGG